MKEITFKDLLLLEIVLNLFLFLIEKWYYSFISNWANQILLTWFNVLFFFVLLIFQYENKVIRFLRKILIWSGSIIVSSFCLLILVWNFSVTTESIVVNSIYNASSTGIIFLVTYWFLERFYWDDHKIFLWFNFSFVFRIFGIIIFGWLVYFLSKFLTITQLLKGFNYILNIFVDLIVRLWNL